MTAHPYKERKAENMDPEIFIKRGVLPPINLYDDGNIPKEDLPQDVIPDEVPRKDGPGGEGE